MRGKASRKLAALIPVLFASLFLVGCRDWEKVEVLSQQPRVVLGSFQGPRVVLGSLIENAGNLDRGYRTREGAVAYAREYWNRVSSCGYSYHQDGGDCAHFVSHCLLAGGLDNRGHGKSWKGNERIIVGVPRLYRWLVPRYGTVVKNVRGLEPGDVVFYGTDFSHVTLYIGGGKVAGHSPNRWKDHYRMGRSEVILVHVNYPQGEVEDNVKIPSGANRYASGRPSSRNGVGRLSP